VQESAHSYIVIPGDRKFNSVEIRSARPNCSAKRHDKIIIIASSSVSIAMGN
jgi:hypothetical protein